MSNVMSYKGYHTRVEYNAEDKTLYGKIEGISDLVTFEAEKCEDVEREFHEAVDDYLEFCEEVGKAPDKEYNGSFNGRIEPNLHREIALSAFKNKRSMNKEIAIALQNYLHPEKGHLTTTVFVTPDALPPHLGTQRSTYRPFNNNSTDRIKRTATL